MISTETLDEEVPSEFRGMKFKTYDASNPQGSDSDSTDSEEEEEKWANFVHSTYTSRTKKLFQELKLKPVDEVQTVDSKTLLDATRSLVCPVNTATHEYFRLWLT